MKPLKLISEVLADQILDAVRDEIARTQGPWLDRTHAAAYAQCSEADIHVARAKGELKTYWWHASPRFRKSDIDELILSGKIPTSQRGRKTKPTLKAA